MGRISIKAEHDPRSDVTTVWVCGRVETEEDCEEWLRVHLNAASRTRDYAYWVSVLHMFSVAPNSIPTWAKYTAQFVSRWNGIAIAVGYDLAVASVAHLSAVQRDFFADDIAQALATIERIRHSDNPRPRKPSATASLMQSPRWREGMRIPGFR